MGVALGKAEMGTGDEADADEGATGGALAHAAMTDGLVPRDVVDFVAGGATETAAGEGSGGSHCARVPPSVRLEPSIVRFIDIVSPDGGLWT